jgi:hypothetical protein
MIDFHQAVRGCMYAPEPRHTLEARRDRPRRCTGWVVEVRLGHCWRRIENPTSTDV